MIDKSNNVRRRFSALFFALSFFLGAGCATVQRPVTGLLDLAKSPDVISDRAIVTLASRVLENYGMRALNSEILSTSGEISLFTLSTATVAMAAAGANPTGTMVTASIGNWLLRMLGVVKPDQRDAAFNEGSEDILRAVGDYVVSIASQKINVVPSDRLTQSGAVLLRKTLAAIASVNRQMVGLRPRFDDIQTLEGAPSAAAKPTAPTIQ